MFEGGSALRRRCGSETEQPEDGSYVVPANGKPSFQVTKNNVSPLPSPNPRNNRQNIIENGKMSSSRDRTMEFVNTVRSLQGRTMNGHPTNFRSANPVAQQSSDFMRIAKSIGKDITSTFTKLEKLTILAKRKTIFDDKPVEIQELTYIIKEDINMLNKQIAKLQEIAKTQRMGQGKHQQSHSASVVVALQTKLANMSNNFKEVLDVRTENLKSQKNRAEQFSSGAVTSSLPQSAVAGFHRGSVLAAEDDMSANQGSVAIDMGGPMQAFIQDDSESYLTDRADTMHTIESTIVELGGIFSQLAHMVKEQEEMVQRIDENVDSTAMNVDMGHQEILKYFQSVTSNRWLMIKIFGVLIFFFIFFVIFMA